MLTKDGGAGTAERGAERYERECRRRLVDQYAPAVPLGVGFNLVLAALCFTGGASRAAGTLICIAAAFALTHPLTRTAWARRHPYLPILGIAALCAVGAATTTSLGSSFHVSGWAILLVCWGMGATQLSLPTPVVAAGIGMQLAIFLAVLRAAGAPPPESPGLVFGLQLSGALLALEGSRRLHRRDRALFDEETELRRQEAALRLQEAELSTRGRAREEDARRLVEEHLAGARTVEALEALLRERVRARSRRIADEVTKDAAPPRLGPLPSPGDDA